MFLHRLATTKSLDMFLEIKNCKYHNAKTELDNLYKNDILNANEVELLITSLHNIEDNLLNNDDLIRERVSEMGDEDYVALSDRLVQQGITQGYNSGLNDGITQTLKQQITKKLQKGKSIFQIAEECELTENEVQKYVKEIEQ